MKRIRGHDTSSLSVPKVVLLEAVRCTGHREHIVEITHQDIDSPSKEILPYTAHLVKYGFPLDPGHSQRFENYSKPLGFPVHNVTQGERTDLCGYPVEEDPERAQGRSFKRPQYEGKARTPVAGTRYDGGKLPSDKKRIRGQGEGGKRGRDKESRKRGRRPRNPLLQHPLTREHLTVLCATKTQGQIAQEVNCSRGYLCLTLKRFGLKAVSGHLPKTDQDPEIIRLAKIKTVGELSEHFGKSRNTINQKLVRLGITAVRGKCGKRRKI